MHLILSHCLASLLYHLPLVLEYKERCPILAQSSFFEQPLEMLRAYIKVGYPWEKEFKNKTVTGIPPHVLIMKDLEKQCLAYNESMQQLLLSIRTKLEQHQFGGQLHAGTIRELLEPVLTEIQEIKNQRAMPPPPLLTLTPQRASPSTATNTPPMPPGNSPPVHSPMQPVQLVQPVISSQTHLYYHHGKYRKVPQGWSFPVGSCFEAFKKWCCPSTYDGHPVCPLHMVAHIDVDHIARSKKMWGEYKSLMKLLQDEATQLGLWRTNLALEEADAMFHRVYPVVQVQFKKVAMYDNMAWGMTL